MKEIKVKNAIQIDLPLFIKADNCRINIIDISIINVQLEKEGGII